MKTSPTIPRPFGEDKTTLDRRSLELRQAIVGALGAARRGHVGSAFSLVEILRVLYDDVLRFDPRNPHWAERDRCILSKGHGCLALYALLADKGFFSCSELSRFCQSSGILGGHPEQRKVPGVEASTGSLGHVLLNFIGSAFIDYHDKMYQRDLVITDGDVSNEATD